MAGRPLSHPPTRPNVKQISENLGITYSETKYLLDRHGWWLHADRRREPTGRISYDARVIDKLRALLGQEHNPLVPPERDWLSAYLKEQDATRQQHPRAP